MWATNQDTFGWTVAVGYGESIKHKFTLADVQYLITPLKNAG
jgi:hypothetical protein